MDIKPLDISVKRAAINNSLYYVYNYDEYCEKEIQDAGSAVMIEKDGKNFVLPIKGEYENQSSPGIYSAGCIDVTIFPEVGLENNYVPEKIVQIRNRTMPCMREPPPEAAAAVQSAGAPTAAALSCLSA